MTKKLTYLVTGGAGFIGSNIAAKLISLDQKVRVIDNFATGRRENIEPLLSGVTFIEGDINDVAAARGAMEGADIVLHLAAIPSVQRSVDDPVASNHANVSGTLNLLNLAKELKVRRFVYSASSSAYGDTPTLPKKESMQPNPLSPYAISKYVGELYCKTFFNLFGLETISLRYFNVFGPKQDPNSHYAAVIPKFITALLGDEVPVIFGDGEQTRDFSFIDNVVHANLLAASCGRTQGEVVNIACGERYSLNQLFSMLCDLTGRKSRPRYEPARLGDVRDSLADISSAKEIINYEPVVFFREGLERTVAWYRG
jgi:nucleoside-diphosphate-sugar epimerase